MFHFCSFPLIPHFLSLSLLSFVPFITIFLVSLPFLSQFFCFSFSHISLLLILSHITSFLFLSSSCFTSFTFLSSPVFLSHLFLSYSQISTKGIFSLPILFCPPLMPHFLPFICITSHFLSFPSTPPSPNYHISTHSESNKTIDADDVWVEWYASLVWKRGGERGSMCSVQLEGAFSARFCPFREYDITHREFPAACIFGHNIPRRAWQTARNRRFWLPLEKNISMSHQHVWPHAQYRFAWALMNRLTGGIQRCGLAEMVCCHEISAQALWVSQKHALLLRKNIFFFLYI